MGSGHVADKGPRSAGADALKYENDINIMNIYVYLSYISLQSLQYYLVNWYLDSVVKLKRLPLIGSLSLF